MIDPRYVGFSPEPLIRHHELVELILSIDPMHPDFRPDAPDTWRTRDRDLTPAEQHFVRTAIPAVWDDALALLELDTEQARARLAWKREQHEAEEAMRRLDEDQ